MHHVSRASLAPSVLHGQSRTPNAAFESLGPPPCPHGQPEGGRGLSCQVMVINVDTSPNDVNVCHGHCGKQPDSLHQLLDNLHHS